MCGICGQLLLNGEKAAAPVVASMVASLRHRGPDDEGIFVEENVGLGHTRLSIIDLSPAGHQPMFDATEETVIVFNGEIYNYRELREQLLREGVPLRSRSDTEVILYLYRKHGVDCPKCLRGMFAFAIWDRKCKRLFAVRDRIGIKPFYYYWDNHRLIFASEMKAIAQVPNLDLALSPQAIATYFTYGHSFAPDTIYRKIKKLRPGNWLLAEGHRVAFGRYWDLPMTEPARDGDLGGRTRELLHLLSDSVRCHLIADVPVGVFLSGGVDSGLVAALAARESAKTVQTFSVGFDAAGYYNELEDARRMARAIESDHHEIVVRSLDVPTLLEKLVWHYDEPFADPACLPTYMIAEFARSHVKVILSGEGGDEVFGGYRRYITQLLTERYWRFAWLIRQSPWLRRMVEARKGLRRVKKLLEAFDCADGNARYAHWLTTFTRSLRQELFAGALREFDRMHDAAEIYHRVFAQAGSDPVNRLLYVDVKTWLPDTYLEKVDKATMAVGLEARVPLLDAPVVEYAFSLPGSDKISRFRKKFILRAAAAHLVPQPILNKPKHGFAVPVDEWFRGPLRAYARAILLDARTSSRGYLSRQAIERVLDLHQQRHNDYGINIWQLINFELWQRRYLDAPERLSSCRQPPGLLGCP